MKIIRVQTFQTILLTTTLTTLITTSATTAASLSSLWSSSTSPSLPLSPASKASRNPEKNAEDRKLALTLTAEHKQTISTAAEHIQTLSPTTTHAQEVTTTSANRQSYIPQIDTDISLILGEQQTTTTSPSRTVKRQQQETVDTTPTASSTRPTESHTTSIIDQRRTYFIPNQQRETTLGSSSTTLFARPTRAHTPVITKRHDSPVVSREHHTHFIPRQQQETNKGESLSDNTSSTSPQPTTQMTSETLMTHEVALLTIYLSVVLVLSLVCNGTIGCAFYSKPQLLTVSNYFVLNLACCELGLSLLILPLSMASLVHGQWMLSDTWCRSESYLLVVLVVALHYSLLAISLDRNFAIVNSLRYPYVFTHTLGNSIVAGTWILGLAVGLPPLVGWGGFKFDEHQFLCSVDWEANLVYSLVFLVLVFILPLFVHCWCYLSIFRAALGHTKRSSKIFPASTNTTTSSSTFVSTATTAPTVLASMNSGESCTSGTNSGKSCRCTNSGESYSRTSLGESCISGTNSGKSCRCTNSGECYSRTSSGESCTSGMNSGESSRHTNSGESSRHTNSIESRTSGTNSSVPCSGEENLLIPMATSRGGFRSTECKAVKTIILITAAYFMCWTLFIVVSVLKCGDVNVDPSVEKAASALLFLSCIVNPLIYGFMNRVTRFEIWKLWGRLCQRLCGRPPPSFPDSDDALSSTWTTTLSSSRPPTSALWVTPSQRARP